jgi:hypothetical protein
LLLFLAFCLVTLASFGFFVFCFYWSVGFILLALSGGSVFGLSSAFFYLVIYLFIVFSIRSFFFVFLESKKALNLVLFVI